MIVDLDKEDIIKLVIGTAPSYSIMDEAIYKKTGQYIGGMVDSWKWNKSALKEYPEEVLFSIYAHCKKAGNNNE